MFLFRYLIEFQNGDVFSLYGEDFFGDKSTFLVSHQSRLNELFKKVVKSDFPIKITDLATKHTLLISNLNEFIDWLKGNQPFSDTLKTIDFRNELIYSELLDNCKFENTYEFDYYWEIWGVMWYPWTIEINKKPQAFTFNDISDYDLTMLVKLNKLELIKTYDKSEMKDELDRKKYKVNL